MVQTNSLSEEVKEVVITRVFDAPRELSTNT